MGIALAALLLLGFSPTAARAAEVAGSTAAARAQSEALVQRSAVALVAGDLDQAGALASQAVTADPGNARAYLQRSAVGLKAKDFSRAAKDASKAMDLGYRKASAFNSLSAALAGLGRYKEAVAEADVAVSVNPNSPTGYLNRAAAKEGMKAASDEILADYARAADLDKRWKTLYEEARKRYTKEAAPAKQPEAAEVPAKKVEAREPQVRARPAQASPGSEGTKAGTFIKNWKTAVGLVVALLGAFGLYKGSTHRATRRVRFASVVSVPLAPGDEPRMGAVLGGRYIVGRLLGKEGSADLYEARGLDDEPCRILRLARRDGPWLKRVEATIGLKHAAILAPESVFEHQGHVCLAGPVFAGEPLRQALERLPERRLPPEGALRILQALCAALDFAHERGVLHGHLSPAHVLVERASVRVKAFALPVEPSDADCLAPEQDAGGGDKAADVFAAGACLYEMLAGQKPFSGADAQQAKREGRFPKASSLAKSLPEGVDELLARALEPEPARRFPSAGALFGAFRNVVVPGVH